MMYAPFTEGWGNWLTFGFHGLGMLLFWGLLIWAIIALVRAAAPAPAALPAEDPALALARLRYARGELTREQFEDLRGRLT